MKLTLNTTFREFQEAFLAAIENATMREFCQELEVLVRSYPRFYMAWIFLARVKEHLGVLEDAQAAYSQVLRLLDPSRAGRYSLKSIRTELLRFCQQHHLPDFEQNVRQTFRKLGIDESHIQTAVMGETAQTSSRGEPVDGLSIKKSQSKAFDLIKKGNKSFTQKNPQLALKYFQQAEQIIPEPTSSLFINMANAALALKDPVEGNRIALRAIEKGIRCKSVNSDEIYVLRSIEAQVYRRQKQWNLLRNTYQNQLENASTPRRQVFTIMGLIEANFKIGDIQTARDWIDELLVIDPNNKVAERMLARLEMYDSDEEIQIEDLEEIGEEFAVEIAQTLKFEVSPMLQVDIEAHKYTDPEIIKKGGKPSGDDVSRMMKHADRSLERALSHGTETFVFYPLYLEVAKACSDLPSEAYDEALYHRSLSRYASLRAGAFFNDFKNLMLTEGESHKNYDLIRRLRDSAASYYVESLRLRLDKNEILAEQIVDNYIKLNAIYANYKKGLRLNESHFIESFRKTTEKCLRFADTTAAFCDALLNIGSANPENFNRIFGGGATLLKQQPRLTVVRNTKKILESMAQLLGVDLDPSLSINKHLRTLFEKRLSQIESLKAQFSVLRGIEFNPKDVRSLSEVWSVLPSNSGAFYESDKEFYSAFAHLIDEMKPYLERSNPEQLAIITHLNERMSEIGATLQRHPTFWGRIGFEPLLTNWQRSLERLVQRRSKAIQPKLSLKIDPPFINVASGQGSLNVIVRNDGAASADNIIVSLQLFFAEGEHQVLCSKEATIDADISPGDFETWHVTFGKEEMQTLGKEPLQVELHATIDFREHTLKYSNSYTITVEQATKLSLSDIPWNETGKVPKELFKGRDEILDKLEAHYLSRDRIETYILYGLTRHGKSSIHRFLSQRLFLKVVETESGPKRFLPFTWSFATANQDKAEDMWTYLIKDTILDQLEKYVESSDLAESLLNNSELKKYWNREKGFRNTHFHKILRALNDESYLPFIAIDEFTYYTEMIDRGIVRPSFLQQIREITIDEQLACFIFAGIYDLVEILKDPKYGITSQLANARQYQVGPIDPKSSEELIQVISDKLKFTDDAVRLIQFASNNIPHFIQMICRRCGRYAVETNRNVMGVPEVDLVIATMAGENQEELPGEVRPLEGQFRDTQYRTNELYNNAVISTIVLKSKDLKIPRAISREEMIQIWGGHRASKQNPSGVLGNFLRKLTNAIETLVQRGVLIEERSEGIAMYRIAVDLFRRWWATQYPDLESELDKLIGVEDDH